VKENAGSLALPASPARERPVLIHFSLEYCKRVFADWLTGP
jgi:hypothetical protein